VTGGPRSPQVGSPVPDFQLVALDGTPFRLSDQLGKVVVVLFASWCNHAGKEAPELRQAWDDYPDQERAVHRHRLQRHRLKSTGIP
jgi:peroxiredoxin